MMAELLPVYQYEGDNVYAVFENHVIASGTDFAKVSETAMEYLEGLSKQRKDEARKEARRTATHITTPNGLEGQIISRVEGVWGSEITVRLSNNEIRHYSTAGDDSVVYSKKAPESAPKSPREHFEAKLAETYATDRHGLTERLAGLDELKVGAGRLAARESNFSEARALDKFVLSAEAEQAEIKEALAHLDDVDAQNAVPVAPQYAAVEQVGLGRAANDSWLDVVAAEMVAESEDQDFDKLLEEGPVHLVSNLDDGAIHHAGTVAEIAQQEIMGKTAGFQGKEIEAYREAFVANVEQARRRELSLRQDTTRKTASTIEASVADMPDEFLFGI